MSKSKELELQRILLEQFRENTDNFYKSSPIYTVLFDLVSSSDLEEVATMLHDLAIDLDKRKELEDKFDELKEFK